ncbi:hypothetical protein TEA_018074 [Camellia sinensis var. sinensis]|uniref:Uncharacterized protein n=1 Tax=Camellia sinensis var. sinensis TaxID=542762 RepID=A0A4S4DNY8_CAMSN|nr:hypothetical protein TEA_018074 [Camellia sinensis var. sinensis]
MEGGGYGGGRELKEAEGGQGRDANGGAGGGKRLWSGGRSCRGAGGWLLELVVVGCVVQSQLCPQGIIDLNALKAQITKMLSRTKLPNCPQGINYQNAFKASFTISEARIRDTCTIRYGYGDTLQPKPSTAIAEPREWLLRWVEIDFLLNRDSIDGGAGGSDDSSGCELGVIRVSAIIREVSVIEYNRDLQIL